MTTLPETKACKVNIENEWLTISFNQPEKRNALTNELTDDIKNIFDAARDDLGVRGVTMRGEGGIFCAGGDLKMFKTGFQGGEQGMKDVEEASALTGAFFDMINSYPKPVVMLAEGAAMAGGLGMLCAGDIVVVTEDCKFALTETTLGIPPAQIAPFVAQRIGLAKARRIMLTAARFTGKEAFEMGLVQYVSEQNGSSKIVAESVLEAICQAGPIATKYFKEAVKSGSDMTLRDGLILETDLNVILQSTSDRAEGIASFMEKRTPKFTGE